MTCYSLRMRASVPLDLKALGLWTSPGPRVSYPHLGPIDSKLVDLAWYLDLWRPSAVLYDHPVGEGRPGEEIEPGVYRELYRSLTRLRVDVVLLCGKTLWAVEAKYEADPHALGQALVYADLLQRQLPTGYRSKPAVLCWHGLPDTAATYERLRVKVWELEPLAERIGIRDLGPSDPRRVGDVLESMGLSQ